MDKQRAIKAALLRQMLASSNTSIITSTLLAMILAYELQGLIDTSVITIWLTLTVFVAIAHSILVFVYKRNPLDKKTSPDVRLLRFRLGVLTVGLVWGMAGVMMFPFNDPLHQLFLSFILAGLTAGGVLSYAADLTSAIGFSILASMPIVIRLFVVGDSFYVSVGMAVILYLGFLIVILRYMNSSIRENIILHLEASAREDTARERYQLLLNYSPIGIMYYDTNLVVTYCNDRFADTLHYLRVRLIGLDLKQLNDHSFLPALTKALEGEYGYYDGHYFTAFNEAIRWITMTCVPSRNAAGKIIGGVSIAQDVTAVHESNQQMYSLLNSMAEGAYGIDKKGRFKFVNRALLKILGYEHADELIGRNAHQLIHHSYPDGRVYPDSNCNSFYAFLEKKEIHVTDEVFWKKDGSAIPVEYWSQPIINEGFVLGAVVTFVDITERKLVEEQIHSLAFYDSLTQLPNRRLLIDRLSQAIQASTRSGRYSAVLFLDLDNFKPLNDLHGHSVGDLLLIEVAKRLKSCVRQVDTVGRFGGDEFVVVLSELDKDKTNSSLLAGNVAEKIRATLAEPYTLQYSKDKATEKTVQHRCKVSIGVVVFLNKDVTTDDLITWADKAMYRAKEAGRNAVVLDDSKP
jgi:diguanylate cyclase (GGDEF)-like protein/PAS domain S-box-containing protein